MDTTNTESALKRAQIALDNSYEIERLRIVVSQFTEDDEVLTLERMDPRAWIV
jgi:hypothetical protein